VGRENLVGVYAQESTARADAAVLRRAAARAGLRGRSVDCLPRQVPPGPDTSAGSGGAHRPNRSGSRDTALVTRLVVIDAVPLALVAAHVVWASRTNRGSHVSSFSGPGPAGRARWVRPTVTGVIVTGLLPGTNKYGLGTQLVNLLVFLGAVAAVCAHLQAVHNRALDRR